MQQLGAWRTLSALAVAVARRGVRHDRPAFAVGVHGPSPRPRPRPTPRCRRIGLGPAGTLARRPRQHARGGPG